MVQRSPQRHGLSLALYLFTDWCSRRVSPPP